MIARCIIRGGCNTRSSVFQHRRNYEAATAHQSSSLKLNDRLRILFCGTDDFSIASLRALHEYASKSRDQPKINTSPISQTLIESIEVVTRRDKRTGRGLKTISQPPIKAVAEHLGLKVHQIDTFKEWTPPSTDLIVAVSFGLLIPERMILDSTYGGVNVHPSILPALRGAAPIQWAIMLGQLHTGVSVQTLHPTKFDEGTVLDQKRYTLRADTDTPTARNELAPIGASILVNAISSGAFRHPTINDAPSLSSKKLVKAPKIQSDDYGFNARKLTASQIRRKSLALGKLYSYTRMQHEIVIRLSFPAYIELVDPPGSPGRLAQYSRNLPIGVPFAIENITTKAEVTVLYVRTPEGFISISQMTVEGRNPDNAFNSAKRAKLLLQPKMIESEDGHTYRVTRFHAVLTSKPGPSSISYD